MGGASTGHTAPKIAVLGSFNMDLVVTVDRLPGPGETVLGSGFAQGPGGKGSNQAIAGARLGADVSFIGAVGPDAFGDAARRALSDEGVDTTALATASAPTGTALIVVDRHGENQIAVASGANAEVTATSAADAADLIAAADLLVMQLEVPVDAVEAAARVARTNDTAVLLNPAPYVPLPADLLGLVDVLTPNEHEVAEFAPSDSLTESARRLVAAGPGTVIVTQGGDGVLVHDGKTARVFPASPAEPVDTTGAGDAFTGALGVALANGAPLEPAVRFALRAGAFSVSRHGVLDGLARLSELGGELPGQT